MKVDFYTKFILTVIALLLAAAVAKDIWRPQSAQAQQGYYYVRLSSSPTDQSRVNAGQVVAAYCPSAGNCYAVAK